LRVSARAASGSDRRDRDPRLRVGGADGSNRGVVREFATRPAEHSRYGMHCLGERDAAAKDVGIEVLCTLEEQRTMSRAQFGDRRER
jgi:hypothetical protein